jgi:hypothetical protein
LVLVPRWLDPSRLSDGAREALRLLAAAPRGLALRSLPEDVHELVDQGFVFADPQRLERVLLPAAFRLQLPGSPSDSPRAARLLLGQVPEEARRELCHHHLQRLPPLPWPMLLETVLERLEDASWVKQELTTLSDPERALLSAIDTAGGEASGEEVLELSREPVRIAHGGTVQVPRRSAIFMLARRGLVLARGEGWQIPDEVERIVGRERRARAGLERQKLLMSWHQLELTPSRAELATPPGMLTVALLAALSSIDQLPHEGRGMSKGAVRKIAAEFAIAPERAELLVVLARADGLLYATAPISQVSERLWSAWRRGGAWDEAGREPDLFRPGHPLTARATTLMREALLDTLLLMPTSQFALASDVLSTAASDRRGPAAQRALALAARTGHDVVPTVAELTRVLLVRSLPFLGLIDVGQIDAGQVVRLSQAARAWLDAAQNGELAERTPERVAQFRDAMTLVCGAGCSVAPVIESARYGDAWLDEGGVGIRFSDESLSRGADHDPDLAGLRGSLSGLISQLPEPLQRALETATRQRPLYGLARVGGFLEIEDPALRKALWKDPDASAVFAAMLSEGLLVRSGVGEARVQALLMRHGGRLFIQD